MAGRPPGSGAGPPAPAQGSHPLPDPAAFAAGMGRPVDAQPGHIPGARNVPFRGNLDGAGRFRPPEQLRQRFAAVRVGADSNVVSYCGSGVTACHNLLALELAGFAKGRLYAGSWSQYSARPGLPVATGAGDDRAGS